MSTMRAPEVAQGETGVVAERTSIEKALTGVADFDEITGGGLPAHRATLVVGGPGAGKTVFALQCLVTGAREMGEPGIFVAFEENSREIITNAATFGWDLPRLERDRVNLVTNAIKFTDADGRVWVECDSTDTHVLFTVHDTGRGIAGDKLEAVFEPFVQVNQQLTRQHEGVGLGLAISRDLARTMGGELSATSALGEGSHFTVRLPRAAP